MFDDGEWLNAPAMWRATPDTLTMVTDARTDFWRETHYGFIRDSGHFYGRQTASAFTATLRIRARYEQLYDQAGIMVRLDTSTWIKAGIELSDGEALLSSVLTVGQSDWATGPCRADPSDLWLRVTVQNGVLRLQSSTDGLRWPLLRLCPFPVGDQYLVGPFCATPERAGLEVMFSDFTVAPPTTKDLHDIT